MKELIQVINTHVKDFNRPDKEIVSTQGESVVSSSNMNTEYISPCNPEEAGYQIVIHLNDMAIKGFKKIKVRTVDTDVSVLCAAYFHEIQGLEELWITFGTVTSAQNIPIHSVAERLGPEKCIVKVYAPDIDEASVNRARLELFHYSGKDFDSIPPTEDAAGLHILHTASVAGHI